ncbi:hypothetical protein GF318_02345 [Candidatus Micrarchaeota archaeon]|nr:hypothetical protein [Candidatus Micrarchaeota archaeon]
MRQFIFALLAAFFVLGCVSGPSEGPAEVPDVIPGQEEVELCDFESSFSGPGDGHFGKTKKLTGSVTCGAGQTLELTVDGQAVDSRTIQGNSTTTVTFDVPGLKTGALPVEVSSAGKTLYSREWGVEALGNQDVTHGDFDSLSFKLWRAMAFDIETAVDVGRISAYMKRLEGKTQPNTNLLVEIRKDENGEPGELVDSTTVPIEETTLTYNWIHFDFSPRAGLQEGRYWVVMQVEQTENIKLVSDAVMLHYMTVDRLAEGNDYTLQMALDVDEKTGYVSETEWVPLSYDREYNIILSE